MKKSIFSVLLMSLLLMSCSGLSSMKSNSKKVRYQATPNPVETRDDKVVVKFVGSIPEKYFNKGAAVFIQPVFTWEGGSIPLDPVTLKGENVNGEGITINYENGGRFTYTDEFDFKPGMETGRVTLAPVAYMASTTDDEAKFADEIQHKTVTFPTVLISDGVNTTSTWVNIRGNISISPINYNKTQGVIETADIYFPNGLSTLDWNFQMNRTFNSKAQPTAIMEGFVETQTKNVKPLWIMNGDRQIYGELFTPSNLKSQISNLKPICIIAHGFNGTYHYGRSYFDVMQKLGYQCYVFDFPCGSVNSRSDNNTLNMSILDEQSDLRAIVNYFRSQGHQHIVLIGESQGGLVSALTAAQMKDKVSQLVLVFPALCIPENWRARYPKLSDIPEVTELWGVKMGRRFFEEIHDMNTFKIIGKYRGPVLIVQGDKDQVVLIDDSKRAQKLYKDARLHIIPGAGHGFKPKEFQEEAGQLEKFLKK